MAQRGVPLLALTLASAACAQLRLGEHAQARLCTSFTQSVAATDAADRAYRNAVETTLPAPIARTMLSAMAAFRECAHQVRESAVRQMRETYQRYDRPWDWLDPLDANMPLPAGLSHADMTRLAGIADGARAHVDQLRARANDTLIADLSEAQIAELTQAKLRRRELFTDAMREALQAVPLALDGVSHDDIEKAAFRLTQLAEEWY